MLGLRHWRWRMDDAFRSELAGFCKERVQHDAVEDETVPGAGHNGAAASRWPE